MEKNDNNKYSCSVCGKEFNKAGSCALHEYRKHNIKKEDKKEIVVPTVKKNNNKNKWVFLGKKELEINNKKVSIKLQKKAMNDGAVEINTETGACR